MHKHEDKNCPRCNQLFECKSGNIAICQCYGFTFTEEQKWEIEKRYPDCLCSNCLTRVKNEFAEQESNYLCKKRAFDV